MVVRAERWLTGSVTVQSLESGENRRAEWLKDVFHDLMQS